MPAPIRTTRPETVGERLASNPKPPRTVQQLIGGAGSLSAVERTVSATASCSPCWWLRLIAWIAVAVAALGGMVIALGDLITITFEVTP